MPAPGTLIQSLNSEKIPVPGETQPRIVPAETSAAVWPERPAVAAMRGGPDSEAAEKISLFPCVAALRPNRDELRGWLAEERELGSNSLWGVSH